MSKHTFFIRIAVCLLGLLVWAIGCQEKTDETGKPSKAVSQKIPTQTQKIALQTPKPKEGPAVTATSAQTGAQVAEANPALTPLAEKYDTKKLISALSIGYDSKGRIDPFIPLVKDEPVKVEKKELIDEKGEIREVRAKTPLEKIELSQLKLRAIILAPSGNKALVEESTGKGYIITKGTYLGRNEGKIIRILKDRVVVEELLENIEGKLTTQEKEIKLPKLPGEE